MLFTTRPSNVPPTICLMLEFNCHEPAGPGIESSSSLWLVPYSLAADAHDFDHHKPKTTRIIGPVSMAVAEQVNRSLTSAPCISSPDVTGRVTACNGFCNGLDLNSTQCSCGL